MTEEKRERKCLRQKKIENPTRFIIIGPRIKEPNLTNELELLLISEKIGENERWEIIAISNKGEFPYNYYMFADEIESLEIAEMMFDAIEAAMCASLLHTKRKQF